MPYCGRGFGEGLGVHGLETKGPGEEADPKSFILCQIFIPATGYMRLTEQGRLETKKEGERRLYGDLIAKETETVQGEEVLLYEVIPELHKVESRGLKGERFLVRARAPYSSGGRRHGRIGRVAGPAGCSCKPGRDCGRGSRGEGSGKKDEAPVPEEEDRIYVTPSGRRYHRDMMCPALANAMVRREVTPRRALRGQCRGFACSARWGSCTALASFVCRSSRR